MNALKLITFDVTGTLLKLQPIPAVTYSQTAKDFGINVSPQDISLHFKPQWRKMSTEHPNFGRYSGLGWHKWWEMFVKNTFVKAVPSLSFEDVKLNELVNFLIEEYKTNKWWRLTDGAKSILTKLNAANVPVGIISNYDPRLEALIEAIGIREQFKFVITSYAVGAMKPDRKIFQEAKAQISDSCLNSCNCMHIGNDLELDYKGAVNAGWSAAIIDPKFDYKKSSGNLNDHVFATLNNLENKLEQSGYKTTL